LPSGDQNGFKKCKYGSYQNVIELKYFYPYTSPLHKKSRTHRKKYSIEVEGLEVIDRQAETNERQVHVSL
jgi:hypothetical protein